MGVEGERVDVRVGLLLYNAWKGKRPRRGGKGRCWCLDGTGGGAGTMNGGGQAKGAKDIKGKRFEGKN